MSIDIFDPRTMIDAVKQMKPARTFIRDTFFPNKETYLTEHIDVDLVSGKRKMAPFVSIIVGGKVMDRLGFKNFTFKPSLVSPRRITTAEDVIKRMPGESLYNGMSPADRAAAILGNDLRELDDYITRREEWMCVQSLVTGQIHMVGEGVDQTIDFSHTLKTALTSGDRWSEITSDPIGDLTDWYDEVVQASGVTPTHCIMSRDAAKAFLNNENVKDHMSPLKIQLGQINPQLLPNGVTYLGSILLLGLDVYTYNEWFIDDTDNATEKPMIPSGTVLIASAEAGYKLTYGAFTDVTNNVTYDLPRIPRSWVEEGANQRFLEMASRPLPVPINVDSWFVASVL